MSGQFFADLGIPEPRYHLEAGGGSHATQTAAIMERIEPVLLRETPRAVLVVGDVNSTVAGALVAKKIGIEVIHAEAGLRSFDRSMPEEINRIVTDSISDLLLVTEESGRVNLLREGIQESSIHLIGNLMIDSLRGHLDKALESCVAQRLGIDGEKFGLVTLHRPANVDSPPQLAEITCALETIAHDLELYWPVHPRTRGRLEEAGIAVSARIHLVEPLGYLDFLWMQSHAAVVLTDSGGIQEESTVLGVPCLTLRDNTERPVTITCGTNRLAGTRRETILAAWRDTLAHPGAGTIPPLWDGRAGERCLEILRKHFAQQ
jgi:UDP-N-acetylglucosamine 2-epimerase (non-hydrolysing)